MPKRFSSDGHLVSAHHAAVCFSVLLASAGAAAQQCDGICTDPTKACICVVAPPDADFGLTRLGAVEAEKGRLGHALGVGDRLSNLGEDTIVELACPGGSEVKLHGQFQVIVLPSSEGQDCAFNLLAGNANVLARMPTTLDAGEAVMGSITTQYGMSVFREGDRPHFECVVFEGEAQVRYRDGRIPLGESSRASWSTATAWRSVEVTKVTATEIDAASLVYARADVARLTARGEQPADQRALVAELRGAYAKVFARPRDADARVQMASMQTNLRNPRQVLFHLEQAEQLEASRTDQSADIAELKYTAYVQLGQQENANIEAQRLRAIDANRYRALRDAEIARPAVPVDPGAVRPPR
jgi:hypothetical protein